RRVVVAALVDRVDGTDDLAVADAVVLVEVDFRVQLALAERRERNEELDRLFLRRRRGRVGGEAREEGGKRGEAQRQTNRHDGRPGGRPKAKDNPAAGGCPHAGLWSAASSRIGSKIRIRRLAGVVRTRRPGRAGGPTSMAACGAAGSGSGPGLGSGRRSAPLA